MSTPVLLAPSAIQSRGIFWDILDCAAFHFTVQRPRRVRSLCSLDIWKSIQARLWHRCSGDLSGFIYPVFPEPFRFRVQRHSMGCMASVAGYCKKSWQQRSCKIEKLMMKKLHQNIFYVVWVVLKISWLTGFEPHISRSNLWPQSTKKTIVPKHYLHAPTFNPVRTWRHTRTLRTSTWLGYEKVRGFYWNRQYKNEDLMKISTGCSGGGGWNIYSAKHMY